MTLRPIHAVACIVLLSFAAGCSQSDGPLPVAKDEVPNRLDELSRDLLNVAGGNRNAPMELSDDLAVFVDKAPQEATARELGARTVTALRNTKLSEQAAHSLANQLWIAVAATQLSEHQQTALQDDTKSQLVAAGATAQNADAVAQQVGTVQKSVTKRKRRWYELR